MLTADIESDDSQTVIEIYESSNDRTVFYGTLHSVDALVVKELVAGLIRILQNKDWSNV